MTLQNAPPGLDYERDRKFSKVRSCKSGFNLTLVVSMECEISFLFVWVFLFGSPLSR